MALVNQSVVVALDMSVRMELKQSATALVEFVTGRQHAVPVVLQQAIVPELSLSIFNCPTKFSFGGNR